MTTATIKTIRGDREYPAEADYVEAVVRHVSRRWEKSEISGLSSLPSLAYAAREAREHYQMATVRGEALRPVTHY